MHDPKDVMNDSPITYVYVEKLTLENLLKSLREERVYITRGPKISFSINNANIGDKIRLGDRKVNLKYSCEENLDLRVYYNGKVIIEIPKTSSGNIDFSLRNSGYIYLEFWKEKEPKLPNRNF